MRIDFHEEGFREILTSEGANGLVEAEAVAIAARANAVPSTTEPAHVGPYYDVQDSSSKSRARRTVIGNSPRSMAHEAKTNALQRGV